MSQSTNRRSGQGRKHNRKGRSTGSERFVKLDHYLLKSAAWRALKPVHRALYIELAMRFNGSNNGDIALSVRQGARLVRASKDTVSRALVELEKKGFVKRNRRGSFDWKIRHATTWILTEHALGENLATKDFMRWRFPALESGPKAGSKRPRPRTSNGKAQANGASNGIY